MSSQGPVDPEPFSLCKHIERQYELDLFPRRDEVVMYREPIELTSDEIPESFYELVEIESIEEGELTWSLNLMELEGTLGSVRSGKSRVPHGEKYKQRHNFVALGISEGETDVPLRSLGKLMDDDDNRTPDFIIKSGDVHHVIELATSKSVRAEVVYRAYETKVFSYHGALENRRIDKTLTFTVVVVCKDYVLSTIELPDELVKELIARMRIGLALEAKAKDLGFDIESDDLSLLKQILHQEIQTDLEQTTFHTVDKHELNITPQYMQSCTEDPADSLVVRDFIKELIIKQSEVKQTHLESRKDKTAEQISAYITKFKEGNRRCDLKPVTFFPFIVAREQEASSDIPKLKMGSSADIPHITRLWNEAMDTYELEPTLTEEDPSTLLEEALEEDFSKVKEFEFQRHKRMRKYHRVDLKGFVSSQDMEQLALQGLWAKKRKDDDFMKARRLHQQSGFTWSTNTNDIKSYLGDSSDLAEITNDQHSNEDMSNLLRTANSIMGNPDSSVEIYESWKKTELFRSLDIISDIAYEVAIANKQHCRTKEMILKKLRRYNVYMLLSPTKSTEHCFVSLFIPNLAKIKHESVFGKAYRVMGGYVTDFFSIKQGKLENQSSMPASLISLASFWSYFYKLKDASPKSFIDNKEALMMLKFSLLVRLEDKSQTEETITATRYMYMEMFKSYFSITFPDPFKILSKLTSYPRSRLNLFCLHQIIKSFAVMSERPPERVLNKDPVILEEGEDSVPNDMWSGLLNFVTQGPVHTASKCINLVYLGYLKNKMESPEGNTDFSLIEKTCEEEFAMDKSDMQAMMGNLKGRPRPKQFSKNCIMHGCSMMEKRLKSMFGVNWKSVVGTEILDSLSSKMTIEIATLKASSSIEHKDVTEVASLSNNLSASRIKVLEAVHSKLKNIGLNPMRAISKFIQHIESTSKGVVCDLFKKLQHGGLREIYVLTIESRIVQLFIETISRQLCSYFEEETLTHPKNKLRRLDQHRSNSARISNRDNTVYADFCSSTDKTRWNQNLMMSAMVIPLVRLTPNFFHNPVSRVLNLWTHKLIKLPQRVINLLLQSVQLTSVVYKKLHEEFWNPKGEVFDFKHAKFIRLSSGMMQGILHYTSSLLHLCFLSSANSVIPFMMKKYYPDHSFMMTQVCSSDDSATILTVFSPKGARELTKETIKACRHASLMLETLNEFALYYCMKNSVKTTTGVVDYVEFNSEFIFRNTIAIPIIKFVAASLNLTESESFLERFHTQYNLISDLFSSGFPAYNTHLCQIAQALNHYKTMGYSVNPLFSFWAENIMKFPDPVLGFFLLDCNLCPGVLGYSFSLWKATMQTSIMKRSVKAILGDATEVIDGGGIVQSLFIKHGDVRRWKTMVESLSRGRDVQKMVDEDPEILFRPPRTIMELEKALVIKATMPSVAKSMRRGNPYMQSLAMSVYAINTHCFSKTTVTQDLTGKLIREHQKVAALQELKRRIEEAQSSPMPSSQSLKIMFPSSDRYHSALKVIENLRSYTLVPCSRFRCRRTEVVVQPFVSLVPLSLQQTCTALWFDHKVRTSRRILGRCIESYKSLMPWIKDDIKNTLKSSPFNTYQELAGFISSHSIKTRVYVRVGPSINSKRLAGQLHQLIKKSQKESHILRTGEKFREYAPSSDLISKLSLALTLPPHESRDSNVRRLLTSSPKMYDTLESIQRMSKRDAQLAYMQAFEKRSFSIEEIMTSIQQTGLGLLFGYTRMQQRIETQTGVQWRGKGQCYVLCDQCMVVIDMDDDTAESIEVSSWRMMRPNPSTLQMILRELHLRAVNKPARQRRGQLVARFDGTHWATPLSQGVPVWENSQLVPTIIDVRDVKLKISHQSLSLMQWTPRGEMSILRFKTYPGDALLAPSPNRGRDMADCWINQRSMEAEDAAGWILAADSPKAPREFREWVIDTLIGRLSQKGLTRASTRGSHLIPYVQEEVQEEPPKITDEQLNELGFMAFDKFDMIKNVPVEEFRSTLIPPVESLTMPDYIGVEQTMNDWAFALHNWLEMEIAENIDITSRGVKSFKFLHPFWDALIDSLSEDHPKFWEDVLSGIAHPYSPKLARAVMSLASVREKTVLEALDVRAERSALRIIQAFVPSSDEASSWNTIMEEEAGTRASEEAKVQGHEEDTDEDDPFTNF